jgi:cytochrome c oxidase subunit 4
MAKHNKAAEHAPAAHDEHAPNVKLYIGVFAALMVCTLLTVLVSKFHLPRPQAIALGLSIALVKAALVGAIFMHLWGEAKLIHKFLYTAAFFSAIFIIPMIDFVLMSPRMMDHADVAAEHPDEGTHASAEPIGINADSTPGATTPLTPAAPAKAPKGKSKKK